MKNLNVREEKLETLEESSKLNEEGSKALTGYATIDKPWKKWYKTLEQELPKGMTLYDYFFDVTRKCDWPLLGYYGKDYLWWEIQAKVDKMIKRLTAMGVKEGDNVSFVFLNAPEAIFFTLALSKMGARANLIKFDESPERIKYMCDLAESKYLFISEAPFIVDHALKSIELGNEVEQLISVPLTESMPKVAVLNMLYEESKKNLLQDKSPFDILKEMKKTYDATVEMEKGMHEKLSKCDRYLSYQDWKKTYKGRRMNTISDGGDKVAVIMYTGGTTGGAKGVETTNNALIASAHIFRTSEMDFIPGKTSMSILPPAVSYYFNATFNLMCCGVRVDLISKFEVPEYPKLIERYRPNIFMAGPILFKAMRDSDIKDLSFATDPISGGDKLHTEEEYLYHDFSQSVGCDSWIKQGYGMTESMAAVLYSIRPALKVGSIGIPLKHCEVAIFDYVPYDEFDKDTLQEKKYGEIGEICITGPTVMKRYLNNPEATATMLRKHADGKVWLHSDDLGYMDEDGRLYHCGRAKRMITRAGGKVWLGTIEDAIKTHPSVDNCCCVKLSDEVEREVPVAHVVLKDDTASNSVFDEIDEIVKKNCPEGYVPKYYVRTDDIPITEANKKVDFKVLEKEPILDSSIYRMDGKVITRRVKSKKLK